MAIHLFIIIDHLFEKRNRIIIDIELLLYIFGSNFVMHWTSIKLKIVLHSFNIKYEWKEERKKSDKY